MAINPIDKLKILADAKRLATGRQQSLAQGLTHLVSNNPDVASQLTSLFASTEAEFVALISRINTAIAGVSVTNADRVAFAQATEAEAKA